MATQEQLRELALSWGRGLLADVDTLGLYELAEDEDIGLDHGDRVELEQLVGRLRVTLPPATSSPWRTEIYGRDEFSKVHSTQLAALAAVGLPWTLGGGVRGGTIYELVSGSWKVVHHIKRGTRSEDLPWRKK